MTTADELRGVLDALDRDMVARHFDSKDDEIAPFVVCEGVSIPAFNAYVGDGEGLRIPLRFLALDEGRVVIVDLPTAVHETTARAFESEFLAASGNRREVASCGSTTVSIPGRTNKEGDATFDPTRTTLNRTLAPAPRTSSDWITLAVEVGRSRTWASLVQAATWWCQYVGIQYILLLKTSRHGAEMRYALYDTRSIAARGILPAPIASGTIHYQTRDQAAVEVVFDMHRILSIPPKAALPPGVNATARVDLRMVMDLVLDRVD